MDETFRRQATQYFDLTVAKEVLAQLEPSRVQRELDQEAEDHIRYELATDPVKMKAYEERYEDQYQRCNAAASEYNQQHLEGLGAPQIVANVEGFLNQGGPGGAALYHMLKIDVSFAPKSDPDSANWETLSSRDVASAFEGLWGHAVVYQKNMLEAMQQTAECDEAQLERAVVIERYGGEDPANYTHSSINISGTQGQAVLTSFLETNKWAGGVIVKVLKSIEVACAPYVGEAKPVRIISMYHGHTSTPGVKNTGQMRMHNDYGIDAYDWRGVLRLEVDGQPTTMQWGFVGFTKKKFCYLQQIDSGHMILGGNDLWRYKASRLMHGVPLVESSRHSIIVDWK